MGKLAYLKRIFSAYVLKKESQLSFWHNKPTHCPEAISLNKEKPWYYMLFTEKAKYEGPRDEKGIPQLNYHGQIGLQYNPIAIAQYGLGHVNLYLSNQKKEHLEEVKKIADWLVQELKPNEHGIPHWHHHFNFEYTEMLKSPWYSGLAQGQGISLLLRAYLLLQEEQYKDSALDAFDSFRKQIHEGGVSVLDQDGFLWAEEYITQVPTHILNGFIWGLWGIWDLYQILGLGEAKELFEKYEKTIRLNIEQYDCGYWSLYDLSRKGILNIASPFYHKLHLTQLKVMYGITKEEKYNQIFLAWQKYQNSRFCRSLAFIHKCFFKIFFF